MSAAFFRVLVYEGKAENPVLGHILAAVPVSNGKAYGMDAVR